MKSVVKKIQKIFLITGVLFIVPHITRAGLFSWASEWVSGKVIGGIAYVINIILGFFAGLIFNLGGALVNFALQLNSEILNTKSNVFMKAGWDIILGFADLALILSIIVIAFATILRIESYGMKKTLWRLIVAALLVNFSLVISGVFIDAAGIVTDFFVGKSTGLSPTNMATVLASAFDVQKMIQVDPSTFSENPFTSFGTSLLIAITSTLFIIIFTIIAAIVLFAIFIMFLVRYVVLSVLLIFSPLVLVAWIFPATQSLYKQWWQKFMQWTFFAPICTFFLYLSIVGLQKTGNNPAHLFASSKLTTGSIGVLGGPLLQAIGQMVMAVGLLLASLMVAQKMGISGASAAMGWAQKAPGAVAKFTGRKARDLAGRLASTEAGRERTARWAASKFAPARWASRLRGAAGAKYEEGATKQYKDQAKGYSDERLNNEILASRGNRKNVLLAEGARRKSLSQNVIGQITSDPERMASMSAQFKTQGLNFNGVEKAIGRNSEMVKAAMDKNTSALKKASAKFYAGFSKEDHKKVQFDTIYDEKGDPDIQEAIAHGIGVNKPADIKKILSGVKSKNFDRAHSAVSRVSSEIRITNPKLAEQIGQSLERHMAERIIGGGEELVMEAESKEKEVKSEEKSKK